MSTTSLHFRPASNIHSDLDLIPPQIYPLPCSQTHFLKYKSDYLTTFPSVQDTFKPLSIAPKAFHGVVGLAHVWLHLELSFNDTDYSIVSRANSCYFYLYISVEVVFIVMNAFLCHFLD